MLELRSAFDAAIFVRSHSLLPEAWKKHWSSNVLNSEAFSGLAYQALNNRFDKTDEMEGFIDGTRKSVEAVWIEPYPPGEAGRDKQTCATMFLLALRHPSAADEIIMMDEDSLFTTFEFVLEFPTVEWSGVKSLLSDDVDSELIRSLTAGMVES
jgi:predicted nucleic acid-binding protein